MLPDGICNPVRNVLCHGEYADGLQDMSGWMANLIPFNKTTPLHKTSGSGLQIPTSSQHKPRPDTPSRFVIHPRQARHLRLPCLSLADSSLNLPPHQPRQPGWSGFATPTETFEVRADAQNVSDGVANPVAHIMHTSSHPISIPRPASHCRPMCQNSAQNCAASVRPHPPRTKPLRAHHAHVRLILLEEQEARLV